MHSAGTRIAARREAREPVVFRLPLPPMKTKTVEREEQTYRRPAALIESVPDLRPGSESDDLADPGAMERDATTS